MNYRKDSILSRVSMDEGSCLPLPHPAPGSADSRNSHTSGRCRPLGAHCHSLNQPGDERLMSSIKKLAITARPFKAVGNVSNVSGTPRCCDQVSRRGPTFSHFILSPSSSSLSQLSSSRSVLQHTSDLTVDIEGAHKLVLTKYILLQRPDN